MNNQRQFIASSPVASGSTMTVTVELPSGQAKQAKIYALPSGGLIRSIPLGNKP